MQRREQFRRNPTAAYVGTGVGVVGFALMVLAWSGAAELAAADAQVPFLVASSLIGLGLVVVGVTVMVVETVRRDAHARSIELARLTASLAVLRGELDVEQEPAIAGPGAFEPAPRGATPPEHGPPRPEPASPERGTSGSRAAAPQRAAEPAARRRGFRRVRRAGR